MGQARTGLLLLLIAAAASAGPRKAEVSKETREKIDAYVEFLASPRADIREQARLDLMALGPDILPVLKTLHHRDPDVRHALRQVMRHFQTVQFDLTGASRRDHKLGRPLMLFVELLNDTDRRLGFDATNRNDGRTRGAIGQVIAVRSLSLFSVVAEDGSIWRPTPDKVELVEQVGASDAGVAGMFPIVDPGGRLKFRIRVEGDGSPLDRPGTKTLHVRYETSVWELLGAGSDLRPLGKSKYATSPIQVTSKGSSVERLRGFLQSGDRALIDEVTRELAVRRDEDILGLLREFSANPKSPIHEICVRRLGEAAKPEDFKFIVSVAEHTTNKRVREIAVSSLRNFKQAKARHTLLRLAWNRNTRYMAVNALLAHKHYSTIDRFVAILREDGAHGPWVKPIQDAMFDWIGRVVNAKSKTEVRQLEKWWRANRGEWVKRERAKAKAAAAKPAQPSQSGGATDK
ncbi:MAG: hypothetical protein V3T86_15630 [Planctomycetota bacterium]